MMSYTPPPISLFVTLDVSPSSEQMCNYQSAVPLLLQVQLISPSHHDLLYLAFPSHCSPPSSKAFSVLADRRRYANHVTRSMVWWTVVVYFSDAVVLLPFAVVLRFIPTEVDETLRSSCGSESQRPTEETRPIPVGRGNTGIIGYRFKSSHSGEVTKCQK